MQFDSKSKLFIYFKVNILKGDRFQASWASRHVSSTPALGLRADPVNGSCDI